MVAAKRLTVRGGFRGAYGSYALATARSGSPAPPAPPLSPPPPSFEAVYTVAAEEVERCDHLSGDDGLERWLRMHSLSQDTVLVLHGLDPYDALTALRHMLAVGFGFAF